MSQSNEAARARESLEARLASMRRTLAEDQPEAEGLRGEDILSVERLVCYDVQLSWGGPSDWLRVFVEDGAVAGVEYHYADWGTHEEVPLTEIGVLSRNRRKFRQPINVACPAPGRWGRPNSRVTSRHFDHGNASRTSRPDCSGLDEAD